jgi:hypothetical protein
MLTSPRNMPGFVPEPASILSGAGACLGRNDYTCRLLPAVCCRWSVTPSPAWIRVRVDLAWRLPDYRKHT